MLLLLLLVLVASCGQGPDDLFIVSGRTVTAAGEPLPGVPITATRSRDVNCGEGRRLRDQPSGDGGVFSFDFVRAEIQQLGEVTATCSRLAADFPSGTRVWTDLAFFPYRLQLPEWSDWSPSLTLDDAGVPHFAPAVEPSTLAQCRGTFPERELVSHGLVARAGGALAWEQTDTVLRLDTPDGGVVPESSYAPVPLVLPPEALEDFDVGVTVGAKRLGCVDVAGGGALGAPGPFQVTTRWSSPGEVRLKGRLTPASRGATCDRMPQPCALTDGSLEPVVFTEPTNRFTLRLPQPARVRALAFRGGLVDVLLRTEEVSVRAGSDAVTVRFDGGMPESLDDLFFLDDGTPLRRAHRLVVLERPLGPASVIELETTRTFHQLSELSLFE